MESLRGYSANTVFERTREVVWKLPTIDIVYTGYRFVFFFLSRSHLLPVAQTDRCPSAYLIAQPPPEKDRMSRPTSNPSARAGGQPAAAVGQPGVAASGACAGVQPAAAVGQPGVAAVGQPGGALGGARAGSQPVAAAGGARAGGQPGVAAVGARAGFQPGKIPAAIDHILQRLVIYCS
jgi:hypothetical protein